MFTVYLESNSSEIVLKSSNTLLSIRITISAIKQDVFLEESTGTGSCTKFVWLFYSVNSFTIKPSIWLLVQSISNGKWNYMTVFYPALTYHPYLDGWCYRPPYRFFTDKGAPPMPGCIRKKPTGLKVQWEIYLKIDIYLLTSVLFINITYLLWS